MSARRIIEFTTVDGRTLVKFGFMAGALALVVTWAVTARQQHSSQIPQPPQRQSTHDPQCYIEGTMSGTAGATVVTWKRMTCLHRDGRIVEAEIAPVAQGVPR